jgi:hypothetical protein
MNQPPVSPGYGQSNHCLVGKELAQECERDIPEIINEEVPHEEVQDESPAHGRTIQSILSESALH